MPKAVSFETRQTIGDRVSKLIDTHNTDQNELAKATGVGKNQINRVVNGVGAPGLDLLIAIADVFEVSTDYILGRTFEKKM